LRVVRDATAKLNDGQIRGAEPFYMLRVADTLHHTGHAGEALQMMRDANVVNNLLNDFGSTPAAIAVRNATFLSSCAEVYTGFGEKNKALASYNEAEGLWKKVIAINPQQQVEAEGQIARLCLVRGDLYASSRDGQAEARNEYQRAIDILSKLKANNQIVLEGLKQFDEAKHKLQVLGSAKIQAARRLQIQT
jgi:tetratricopeptide (TPR) repeat protein